VKELHYYTTKKEEILEKLEKYLVGTLIRRASPAVFAYVPLITSFPEDIDDFVFDHVHIVSY